MEASRPATDADLARLVELARSAIAELSSQRGGAVWSRREARQEPLDASLRAALADPAQCVLVGTIDDVVIGYGVVREERLGDGGSLAVIEDLYVEPGARAVGVGEVVMDGLVAWARERGCIGVDSLALPGDRATKNFFEMFGLTARAIVVHRSLREEEQ